MNGGAAGGVNPLVKCILAHNLHASTRVHNQKDETTENMALNFMWFEVWQSQIFSRSTCRETNFQGTESWETNFQ